MRRGEEGEEIGWGREGDNWGNGGEARKGSI